MPEILAIIPARSGSKSVKDKNIRMMADKPMLAYSIEHALSSKYINRVIVSTDSMLYSEIAKKYGAEVPFLRPVELSADTSLDLDVFRHGIAFLADTEGYVPELVVQLRPTYPIRAVNDIDSMIEYMLENQNTDSMRCIAPAKEIAYKMWHKDEKNIITPILSDISEAYNMPRQQLPKIYYQNACIDVIRTNVIMEKNSMSGAVIAGYEMQHNFDIDTEAEFKAAEDYLKIMSGGKRFVFDIDGVVAVYREDLDYSKAQPNKEMVAFINKLYDKGCEIILLTARGYVTGIDWYEVTKEQMLSFGLKFHELKMGKPNADYYVDDKMISLEYLEELNNLID